MKISEIRDGDKRIDVEGKVTKKSDERSGTSRTSGEAYRVVDVTLEDESGNIQLVLWNEDIDRVRVGDVIHVNNGYATVYQGNVQLTPGRYGSLGVVSKL